MITLNNNAVGMSIMLIICLAIIFGYCFYKMSKEEQVAKVREWLLLAVCEAEKALGSGTGRLKLRMVYGEFVDKFTWVAKFMTFDEFSNMVDEALNEMKVLVQTNEAIKTFIENV